MFRFRSIDTQRDGDVQVRTLLQDPGDVGKDPLLDLTVRHDVNRFKIVVLVESARDLRKILTSERLATGQDQDAKIAPERFGDAFNLVRLHLKLLAWSIVQFIRKEAMSAAHIANGSNKNIQQDWRKWLADCQLCITLQQFFSRKIHLYLKFLPANTNKAGLLERYGI